MMAVNHTSNRTGNSVSLHRPRYQVANVDAAAMAFVFLLALTSPSRCDVFIVPGTPLAVELSAPQELHQTASRALRRVCETLEQATDRSGFLPPGGWRIAVDVRTNADAIRISVRTVRTRPDGSVEEWAEAAYRVADEGALGELLPTWVQLAIPLQGRITDSADGTSRAILPCLASWSWMHDPRLLPGSGVLVAVERGARLRPATVASRARTHVLVRLLDGRLPPSKGVVIVPPKGQGTLAVQVVGRNGAPLPGAIVRIRKAEREGPPPLVQERVAGSSDVEFRLPACTPLIIEAHFPGLVARMHRVLYRRHERVEMRLPASPRRVLVVARAHRLLDRALRVQRERKVLLDEIRDAMETGDPDAVEQLIEQLESVRPNPAEWTGELVLIKEEATRYGEDVQGLLEELKKALEAVAHPAETALLREWVEARRRQLHVESLTKRARELTESMQWTELLDCYRELAALTGDEVARQRAAYLEQALRERGPEHRVAREWVKSWVPNASLNDLLEDQDVLELTTEQLIDAGDALYLLIVQRSLQRWTEAIQDELDRLREQANSTPDPDERSRIAERIGQLGELAEKLASLLERIAPITSRIPL